LGALATGAVAGGLFVFLFTQTQNRWRIDDVLGVWPLHGVCGVEVRTVRVSFFVPHFRAYDIR